jgi:hypothetical protein
MQNQRRCCHKSSIITQVYTKLKKRRTLKKRIKSVQQRVDGIGKMESFLEMIC